MATNLTARPLHVMGFHSALSDKLCSLRYLTFPAVSNNVSLASCVLVGRYFSLFSRLSAGLVYVEQVCYECLIT